MVATVTQHHYHYDDEHDSKINDIFEQTVIVDKPLSKHFYDHLKEVTIDAEIVVGRKGVVEEIVPLEQWLSVKSPVFEAVPEEEEWVIEPEETVYTVVKWEGVEGGEKHVVENKQWMEVAHTPPIHTKHHVSPLVDNGGNQNESVFSFSKEDTKQWQTAHSPESNKKSEVIFQKPHDTASTEKTWHTSSTVNTSTSHQVHNYSTSSTENYVNGTAEMSSKNSGENNTHLHNGISSQENGFKNEEHQNKWTKYGIDETQRTTSPSHYEKSSAAAQPTQIPKPRTLLSGKMTSSESSNQTGAKEELSKISVKSSGNSGLSRYSSQPSPTSAQHQFISSKPAGHSTSFMTSYTSNSPVSSPERNKSPASTPGTAEKVTWRRTHGNQYVRETVSTDSAK